MKKQANKEKLDTLVIEKNTYKFLKGTYKYPKTDIIPRNEILKVSPERRNKTRISPITTSLCFGFLCDFFFSPCNY